MAVTAVRTIRQRLAEWVATPGGKRTAADLAFLVALFALVGVAYGPSLKHPPRADQWWFLADTVEQHTFLDTVRHSYSYNRTRQVMAGDTDLFRPVLFTLLAAEKAAFGGHLALTQALGIALHCGICALLLVVLRQIAGAVQSPGTPPGAGGEWLIRGTVAFFALNPCVQELVIWGHLHGYLLFLILLLGSISCLLRFAVDSREGRGAVGYLWAGWGLALVSAFTYELGQFYALLAGLLVALAVAPRVGWRRAAGLVVVFAAIAGLYQAVNRIDREVHRGCYPNEDLGPLIRERAFESQTLTHAARYGVYTTAQPFFPSLVQSSYALQRLLVEESLWQRRGLKVLTPALALSYAAVAASALLAAAGLWRLARTPARVPLLTLLPFGLYALYAAITVLGRMNLRPHHWVLSLNSYYAYFGLLFALLALSPAWHAPGPRADSLRKWLAAVLLALGVLGAERVWQANASLAREAREWSNPIRAVQRFVDEHGNEPGFSFEIDYEASDPVPQVHGIRITRLVFARWMSSPEPRYRLVLRGGKARAVW